MEAWPDISQTQFPSLILAGWPRDPPWPKPGLAEGGGLELGRGLVSQGGCRSWDLINNGDPLIMETSL